MSNASTSKGRRFRGSNIKRLKDKDIHLTFQPPSAEEEVGGSTFILGQPGRR